MARTSDPAVRALLIERAAGMLRAREPITLRSLVDGTGASTMAVYTHFDGMDGLWRALRQEGFTRLRVRLAAVRTTQDPVRDLAALGFAYVEHALHHPDLYRVMFDAVFGLEDARAADETLDYMVGAARRATEAERFAPDTDALDLATRSWAVGHGLASLVTNGPLPRRALAHGAPMLAALYVAAGDAPGPCRSSVARGWRRRSAGPSDGAGA